MDMSIGSVSKPSQEGLELLGGPAKKMDYEGLELLGGPATKVRGTTMLTMDTRSHLGQRNLLPSSYEASNRRTEHGIKCSQVLRSSELPKCSEYRRGFDQGYCGTNPTGTHRKSLVCHDCLNHFMNKT
jgi:hypothetical protein